MKERSKRESGEREGGEKGERRRKRGVGGREGDRGGGRRKRKGKETETTKPKDLKNK